ncbi:nuclease-related domain-containing protein [Metasolibacillus meyeri]|uniref:Nuclease-related domain-containing protein n=1 Tax=Metasolibacillus meyeri TaxID=1071052 RepID=A0AAW9NSV8_9BACL|nr:nuclease-related domain-containing protein [Metasolibacillus meyeri]MEC1180797.1 nuclease-related domain-containing protein [Metasolibacillus meyeri]
MLNLFIVDNLEFVEMKWRAIQAGHAGEARLRRLFDNYRLAKDILFDISLQAVGKFQIDCLIVTERFLFILESKNITGELSFEENPARLVRVRDGITSTFESPEVQLERNMYLLKQWLMQHGIEIPIIGAVVWTASGYPLIVKSPKRLPLLFLSMVPTFYAQQQARFPKILTKDDCERLVALLQAESERYKFVRYPLFPRWQVKVHEVKSGVRCVCGSFAMRYKRASWYCSRCGHQDKQAHIATLKEWFMFVKETISNRETCELLRVKDRHIAKRLLQSANLVAVGTKRATVYKWRW